MQTDFNETQEFNGVTFYRFKPNDYFRASINGRMKVIHRYVWEFYNGEIPEGYDIHHKDGNRANNDITNLEMLERSEHKKYHSEHLSEEERERRRVNMLTNAMPKAVEWHKSEEGSKWHSEHIQRQRETDCFKREFVCSCCGKTYIGELRSSSDSHFCSNACKSKYRRKMGLDLIDAECPVCHNIFRTNKTRPSETCSRSCANRYRYLKKQSQPQEEIKSDTTNFVFNSLF